MINAIRTLVRVPEVRQKIILTIVLLAVYRLGFSIILPIVDQAQLAESLQRRGDEGGFNKIVALLSLLSASNVGMMTIFGLGIMPYISASIVFQLLATVYPPLEALQKEGEIGRRKINEYTRYATVLICFGQSFFWVRMLSSGDSSGQSSGIVSAEFAGIYFQLVSAITMTAGSVLLMWIAEQIDEFGIGNGVSLLIMSGILARAPEAAQSLVRPALEKGVEIGSSTGIERYLLLVAMFVSIVFCVILITQAQRKIPVHSAKHVRGTKVFGGQRQSLPIRINQSGVMPVIFASSLLVFPLVIFRQAAFAFGNTSYIGGFFSAAEAAFSNSSGVVYNICFVGLIYFFCYFWTAVTFNPAEVANNLRDYGSFVPGYRPGARTAAYLEQVTMRITFVGAAFLSVIAVIPTIIVNSLGVDYLTASFFGGTGLLICVSVAIDLVQKIDSHLLVRNQPTLLLAGKV